MHLLILTFTSGILFLQLLPKLPTYLIPLTTLVLLGLATVVSHNLPVKKIWCTLSRVFFAFALGFCWALVYTHWVMHWTLPKEWEGKNIVVTGFVASLPKIETHRITFDFDVKHLAGQNLNTKLLLNWYNDYPNYPELKAGDKWQLTVRLKRPHSTANPGQFDYEAHFLQNRIRATGYIVATSDNHRINSKLYRYTINRLRQYLEVKVKVALQNQPLVNLIAALVVGDQSGISQSQWQVLRRTGTIHFMVIAGLHIGFVFSFMFLLAKLVLKLWPRFTLVMPAPKLGAITGLLGAVIYSTLAGFSIPTKRAIIMITVFMLGILLQRKIASWSALLLGLFIVISLDPLAGLNSGFWLSFAAVALINYALTERLRNEAKWRKYIKLQVTLTLGLMPLTLLLFQQATLISFFGNAIAVPWIGFVVIPLSLSGCLLLLVNFSAGHSLLLLAEKALELIWYWLAWLSTLPIASWQHYIFNNWVLIASLFGMLLLLAPRGLPRRWLGGICLLPLLLYSPSTPELGKVWFTLLDVGQGLAAVIHTQNHALLYDTGPKFGDNSDAGMNVIIPFLRSQGIRKIDMLVLSHGDQDHSGGAKSILDMLPIKQILTSVPNFFLPYQADYCQAGQTWQWDGITFEIVHPPSRANFIGNNASCVLHISAGANSILLTGDIEKFAERDLTKRGSQLTSKILVAPHHGSRTSSTPALIEKTTPQYVLFATGYRNRFHFPHKSVVKRYLFNGAILLNTTETGAITFKFDAKSGMLSPEIYRDIYQHYWRDLSHENKNNL